MEEKQKTKVRSKSKQASQKIQRRSEITKSDITETIQIFDDFGIVGFEKSDIPQFRTLIELENWRKTYIVKYLNTL